MDQIFFYHKLFLYNRLISWGLKQASSPHALSSCLPVDEKSQTQQIITCIVPYFEAEKNLSGPNKSAIGPVFYRLNKLKASLSAIMVTFGCP